MDQTPGWLNTLTGRNLLREEVRQVRRALESVFGDQLLQIGIWGEPALFRRLARTRRAAVLGPASQHGIDLAGDFHSLPVAPDCIDAVFLPHTLELTNDPHALLREVDRILRPDGSLVVLGFNPWGWWGLRHALSRRRFPPGAQRLISEGRLHDWLRLLDFKVCHSGFYYFVPPVIRKGASRQERMGRAGDATDHAASTLDFRERLARPTRRLSRSLNFLRRGPVLAGCYVLVARKQTYVVTPIRPVWRRRAALVTSLVNPTTRNAA